MPAPTALIGLIPWPLLIKNGPRIFDAAQKLVRMTRSSGRNQSADLAPDDAPSPANGSIDDQTAAALLLLEKKVGVLNSELIAATELISSLAEANNVLIHEVQVLRKWLLAISGLSILGAILAAVAVAS
ncbi:hypothetical protein [Sphingomonas sp.]|uniref:hypothetical protein n=1 Tax=Sphingomonas sp. TaxID=28214 RepID=UPI002FC5B179